MKRILKPASLSACLVLAGALTLPCTRAEAQAVSADSQQTPPEPINLFVLATDKHGNALKDLGPDDISIVENKMPFSRLVSLRSASELPLRIGLLIDVSNSVKNNPFFAMEVEQAEAFIYRTLAAEKDEVLVGTFDSRVEATAFMTKEQFAKFHTTLRPGGGTALYDAIFFVCRDRMQDIIPLTQRILIVLSDGADNDSRAARQEAIAAAQALGVAIYWVDTSGSDTNGTLQGKLHELTEETGGRMFRPTRSKQVAAAFTAIAAELSSRYVVTYLPTSRSDNDGFHRIEVVSRRKDVRLRAARGYFDLAGALRCRNCGEVPVRTDSTR